ncbi:hypothetical protein ECANGB1_2764 [Enterospora canceri]|uniref:Uncharacterized protein n=1 Tax=Enterospora canceri TaxID=1081671 RepID=A0A1Y1S9M7_9MICR|nr:hypothetical protein ECANGB1_2764 [Enterospora canceri]
MKPVSSINSKRNKTENANKKCPNMKKQKGEYGLFFFTVVINIIFTIQSLLVERVSSYEYNSGTKFSFPYLIVFLKGFLVLCTINTFDFIISTSLFMHLFLMAVLIFIQEQLSFLGTQLLTYRTMQISSTLKLIPIVAAKIIVFGEKVSDQTLYSCVATTIGSFIFAVDFSLLTKTGKIESNTILGIVVICMILCIQGFVNSMQDFVYRRYSISSAVMILYTNIFKVSLSLIQTLRNTSPIVNFVKKDPIVVLHIAGVVLLGAVGQRIIYSCVKRNGTILTNYITLTRKIISIILTSIVYEHPLHLRHFIGLSFIGLGTCILAIQKTKTNRSKNS